MFTATPSNQNGESRMHRMHGFRVVVAAHRSSLRGLA